MEPAIVLSISFCAVLITITVYGIYTSFGPPSKQLSDPFEDHED
ncbi:photosystem II reaction center protein PsbN [Nostoc sp. PA-18-2419]|nr:photosystem II reaction center protein PsbN [Nostoc sp. PA-18-2419]